MNVADTTMTADPSSTGPSRKAGRIDYGQWDKVASDLVDDHDKEEQQEIEAQKKALGLDGKYARSQAEAEERKKAEGVKQVKDALEGYKKRESQLQQSFSELLGPVPEQPATEEKTAQRNTRRITRQHLEAGKRVVVISDTSGSSIDDRIVLTQDLNLLESKMSASAMTPKTYEGDAENDVKEQPNQTRSIFGLIKAFLSNVHNCTVVIKCKIISGTLEISHCSNLVVRVESEATVATIQADLCQDITIEFRDAPSGKNVAMPGHRKTFWGQDKDDRIFHAGVSNMVVKTIRDDFVESEITSDYEKDGAASVGNAAAEEFQFVTSCVDGKLVTEKVIRAGATTGKNARAMTQRELDDEEKMREKAAKMAIKMAEDMIRFEEKPGVQKKVVETVKEDETVEEVFTSDVTALVKECEENKAKGNEAFGTGEYGQAILLYTLALDKADELSDTHGSDEKPLFARDVVYSNRAACFLKLGQHEKALEDCESALEVNSGNIKALFRKGLALHAMGQYYEALPVLAKALELEPKNKQIKQALQFCEVRLQQDQRKRMEG